MLLATTGMMFLAGAEDLIVLFLGLEVIVVGVYVLAGYNRADPFSSEAALKYFLIGAFASGFLLYGIALVYGVAGRRTVPHRRAARRSADSAHGRARARAPAHRLGFKISAVPFHMWAPDVYDGSPTPVTGFMATGSRRPPSPRWCGS